MLNDDEPIPMSAGIFEKKVFKASMPPAEAPIPTISLVRSAASADGTASDVAISGLILPPPSWAGVSSTNAHHEHHHCRSFFIEDQN
jgi:hypothetical protein